jgi:signal transduction histidine kinase
MPTMLNPRKPDAEDPIINIEAAAGFVRRLTHDVRNTLNALDLQLLLLESGDPVVKQGIDEARQMITVEARRLARVSSQFQVPEAQWVEYPVDELFQDLLPRMQKRFAKCMLRVAWPESVLGDLVKIDFELFAELFSELLLNALDHGACEGKVKVEIVRQAEAVMVLLTESLAQPKGDPADWGVVPFHPTAQGGYGLGLFYGRRLAQAMELELDFHYQAENALLTTALALPIVGAR